MASAVLGHQCMQVACAAGFVFEVCFEKNRGEMRKICRLPERESGAKNSGSKEKQL